MRVDILLATYNGELYIEQQIRSLQSQTYKNWRLLIHDDGSTDKTIDIIKEISKSDHRINLIEDSVRNGGAANNFMYMLQFADAPYIMFCDQDDVWLDSKIQMMYETIHRKNNNYPQVVYSNAYIWNSEDNSITGSATVTFPTKLEDLLFLNSGMQGCVAIFNQSTLELFKLWGDNACAMHDHILHLIGLSVGEVTYINQNMMLYRQHANNVTGGCVIQNKKRSKLSSRSPVVDKEHYDAVNNFQKIYSSYLDKQKVDILNAYLTMPNQSFVSKIIIVLRKNFKIYNSKFKLIIKMIVRPYIND